MFRQLGARIEKHIREEISCLGGKPRHISHYLGGRLLAVLLTDKALYSAGESDEGRFKKESISHVFQ